MEHFLKPLIKSSFLDLIEYSCHVRSEMEQHNRILPFYVMSYLKSGEALLKIYGKEYVMRAGDAIFIPPNVIHDHIKLSKEDAVFFWWHFNYRSHFDIDILSFLHLPVKVEIQNTETFEIKFREFLEEQEREDSLSGLVYKNAKALEVFAIVLESFMQAEKTRVSSKVSPIFIEILNDISENPRADITLRDLGEKYHLNPTYLSNKFKVLFGISPIHLQRKLIVEKAQTYLISSSKSISEIAEILGFSELSSFTRFFNEKAGVSPSKYRKERY